MSAQETINPVIADLGRASGGSADEDNELSDLREGGMVSLRHKDYYPLL